MAKVFKNISIEHARIVFRNFSGKAGKFNPAGIRSFCVLLDNDFAYELKQDGWNVRTLSPVDEGDDEQPYLQVAVKFDERFPTKVVLITSKGMTELDESSVNVLDWAEIENVDVIIRPYNYELASGKKGVKAYLKAIYVSIFEDEFEKKYRNVPDSAMNSIDGD